MNFYQSVTFFLLLLFSATSWALPIDWTGSLYYDTNIIKNVRGTNDSCTPADGSECIKKDDKNARYQSYVLKLNPNIIVNDSAAIKGEISTGSLRGGFLGNDTQVENSSYYSQSTSGASSLTANQLYVELYADTALFKIGKYAKNYGLGAIINSGEDNTDRFFTLYDGFEAQFQVGNFLITPIWSKISSPSPIATNVNPYSGKYDTLETAISAVYDNSNSNLQFGVYYGIREVETNSKLYTDDSGNSTNSHSTTLLDIFISKKWEKFSVGLEIPMLSGDVGTFYGSAEAEDIDANAYIFEAEYKASSSWDFGLHAGMVNGEEGEDSVNAMYLHPNYQIAEIMFRYNLQGFQNQDQNVFNSSITNANYAKLFAKYKSDAWGWNLAFIMANANETAKEGDMFYDHKNNSYQTANADQESDLGYELDVSFDYEWNPGIFVSGYMAYFKLGEYYSFINDANDDISVSDITASGFRLSVQF